MSIWIEFFYWNNQISNDALQLCTTSESAVTIPKFTESIIWQRSQVVTVESGPNTLFSWLLIPDFLDSKSDHWLKNRDLFLQISVHIQGMSKKLRWGGRWDFRGGSFSLAWSMHLRSYNLISIDHLSMTCRLKKLGLIFLNYLKQSKLSSAKAILHTAVTLTDVF